MTGKAERSGIRVFVSSTYLDNAKRRQIVKEAIERAGMVAVGMERFSASTQPRCASASKRSRSATG